MRMHKRPREDTVTRQPLQHEKGEGSRETSPASTLTLNYQPPELWENKLLLFQQKNQNKKTKQKTAWEMEHILVQLFLENAIYHTWAYKMNQFSGKFKLQVGADQEKS